MIPNTLISLRPRRIGMVPTSHGPHFSSGPRGGGSMAYVSMGPVSSALVLYVTDRLVSRVLKGQILRKGVPRKVRYLCTMLMQMNILNEVLVDILEDLGSQFF